MTIFPSPDQPPLTRIGAPIRGGRDALMRQSFRADTIAPQ